MGGRWCAHSLARPRTSTRPRPSCGLAGYRAAFAWRRRQSSGLQVVSRVSSLWLIRPWGLSVSTACPDRLLYRERAGSPFTVHRAHPASPYLSCCLTAAVFCGDRLFSWSLSCPLSRNDVRSPTAVSSVVSWERTAHGSVRKGFRWCWHSSRHAVYSTRLLSCGMIQGKFFERFDLAPVKLNKTKKVCVRRSRQHVSSRALLPETVLRLQLGFRSCVRSLLHAVGRHRTFMKPRYTWNCFIMTFLFVCACCVVFVSLTGVAAEAGARAGRRPSQPRMPV